MSSWRDTTNGVIIITSLWELLKSELTYSYIIEEQKI